ncbi:MAG: type II secretion system protein GspE [Deltaproteobacteria bacterium]|nr:type II secretion system protein GspE [Deltaproteobacteria bacterium]
MRFERQVAARLYTKGLISKEVAEGLLAPPADGPALEEGAAQGSVRERLARQRLVSDAQWAEAVAEVVGVRVAPQLDVDRIQLEYTQALKVSYAKENRILPLWEEGGRLLVGVADPLNMGPMSAFARLFRLPLEPVYVPEQVLIDAVNKVFDRRAAAAQVIDEIDQEQVVSADAGINDIDIDIIDTDDEAPIIRLVNAILSQAIKERASDIHIEPFERHISVRFRVDGVLNEVIQPPRRFHASVSSRIKIMAGLDIAEKRIPQDGRIKLKVAGKEIDIRLSTLPTAHGERLVMRILDKTSVLKDLGHIGMGAQALVGMNELITRSYGIILVTGPTGSGKTTTLYASLAKINSPTRNIITVEDPVEYQLPGIGQTQVNDRVGLTFAAGLRSILRQDPDVVMIGEIRDRETAEIAIQASLTGHLVFSTLHTNDSAGAVTRLVDMGIEPFLISSSVIGMMAQRLVRTLCPACKEPVVPTDLELQQLSYTRERFLAESQGYVYQARGCAECMGNGYRGRTGIYELLHVDDEIRGLIMANVDSNTIKKRAILKGMMTLRDDGTRKIFAGETSISEILRVTQDDLLSFD